MNVDKVRNCKALNASVWMVISGLVLHVVLNVLTSHTGMVLTVSATIISITQVEYVCLALLTQFIMPLLVLVTAKPQRFGIVDLA